MNSSTQSSTLKIQTTSHHYLDHHRLECECIGCLSEKLGLKWYRSEKGDRVPELEQKLLEYLKSNQKQEVVMAKKAKVVSVKGDPAVDKSAIEWIKSGKALFQPKTLTNLDQRSLRDIRRGLEHLTAEVNFYLDIRNEQGRGGKK